jgi:hypothetical protein
MAKDVFDRYLEEINGAWLRGDATEHTHRSALKALGEPFALWGNGVWWLSGREKGLKPVC